LKKEKGQKKHRASSNDETEKMERRSGKEIKSAAKSNSEKAKMLVVEPKSMTERIGANL
jgi:hypothetical protein